MGPTLAEGRVAAGSGVSRNEWSGCATLARRHPSAMLRRMDARQRTHPAPTARLGDDRRRLRLQAPVADATSPGVLADARRSQIVTAPTTKTVAPRTNGAASPAVLTTAAPSAGPTMPAA